MNTEQVCPHCGSAEFIRSRRRWYERVLLVSRAYRCHGCGRRFHVPAVKERASEA
jgi:DNA-directed RNA polymerase subunit RPC12/RpoP